jgi:hypothetical protein
MMDLAALRDLARDIEFQTLGVPLTVTVGEDDPIVSRGIWLTYQADQLPTSSPLQRSAPRKVMALRRDQVATAPRGTLISAPAMVGGTTQNWVVDGYLEQRDDTHRVILIEGSAD